MKERIARQDVKDRLPPGQYLTEKWPVLHAGSIPRFDAAQWDFKVWGLVEQPVRLTYAEFAALPKTTLRCDMHCVTRWSKLDMVWEGVATREVVRKVQPKPSARFVMVHCEHGFTTNLPLDDFLGADCLFAWSANGQDLEPDHGWPLRLVVPRLYFWKSAKWVRGVELLPKDRRGFWERNGYHNHADPWKEERYSSPWE